MEKKMEKKIVGLMMVGLVLSIGNAFGLVFLGDYGGDSSSGYYFSPDAANNIQPPPMPIIEGSIQLERIYSDVRKEVLEGSDVDGAIIFLAQGDKNLTIENTGIPIDNAKAIEYINSLMTRLPQEQQNLLKGVVEQIKNTPDAQVEIDLFKTGEKTLRVNISLKANDVRGLRKSLASLTVHLEAKDTAAVDGIMEEFEKIQQLKDPKEAAQKLDSLFKEKINKLTPKGSDVSKTTELDPKKDAAKITEKIKAVYDYLVANGLETQAKEFRDALNKAITDAQKISLREEYQNGKLVFAYLNVIDKNREIMYGVSAQYKDGKINDARMEKIDLEANERKTIHAYSQAGLPETVTAEEAAKKFFGQYGVDDPVKQFGALTWNKLVQNWGKWTVRAYEQSSSEIGSIKLSFVYGTTKIDLPEIKYTNSKEFQVGGK